MLFSRFRILFSFPFGEENEKCEEYDGVGLTLIYGVDKIPAPRPRQTSGGAPERDKWCIAHSLFVLLFPRIRPREPLVKGLAGRIDAFPSSWDGASLAPWIHRCRGPDLIHGGEEWHYQMMGFSFLPRYLAIHLDDQPPSVGLYDHRQVRPWMYRRYFCANPGTFSHFGASSSHFG